MASHSILLHRLWAQSFQVYTRTPREEADVQGCGTGSDLFCPWTEHALKNSFPSCCLHPVKQNNISPLNRSLFKRRHRRNYDQENCCSSHPHRAPPCSFPLVLRTNHKVSVFWLSASFYPLHLPACPLRNAHTHAAANPATLTLSSSAHRTLSWEDLKQEGSLRD